MTELSEEAVLVDVRKKWQDEARQFTPWLARNLCLLGRHLGMNLQLVQQEKPVGPLYLDILAKDSKTDAFVAIENQLERTDLNHLGRLLIYASGCDAGVVIWIAPEFEYSHAQMLHRLNRWSASDVRFYGIRIEVIKKTRQAAESHLEPRFRNVVYPGGWDEEVTLKPDRAPPPVAQKYMRFFQPLIDHLIRTDFAERNRQHFDHTGRFFPSRENPGVGYAACLEGKNDAWVTLHIRTGEKNETKHLFDKLHSDRQEIELCICADRAQEWHWRRHDRYSFSSINIRTDGSIDDPQDRLEETREWMLNFLHRFKEVFEPRVAAILASLPTTPHIDSS